DPIAIVSVFRRVKVPATIRTIVECESLFNDAVAVVLYRAVLAYVLVSANGGGIARIALESVAGSLGGIAIGAGVAFGAAVLLRNRVNGAVQVVATILCAYGTYFGAEVLGCSGIFAVIACGIALRYFERRWVSLGVAGDVDRFWDITALAANAVIFFLVGAALQVSIVTRAPAFVIAALAGVAVSRFALAWLLLPARFPREWLDVIRTAGMRGALSLALAIALPQNAPYRDAIVAATFAVALATIVSSGLTVPLVVARVARRSGGKTRPNG
ncbi:MAG TPA: cation:proton antiporter, partial [Candidatus Baltobacteraceae bacterium]|nr:cation:proton antiporter [Candidatus Baltobacteraceae bacterium]